MQKPVETVKGKIVDYNPRTQELTIKAVYANWATMLHREYKECLIQPIDSRRLSDKQRRMCYALLREIGEFTGQGPDQTKEWMKIKFLAEDLQETAGRIFSLGNAPMSLICAFQRYLIRFILEWDIPCRLPLLNYVDDIPDYIYRCLATKKCCLCGGPTELHHIDRIGMGRDRGDVIHEGLEVLPLCCLHHGEAHTMPDKEFFGKYHLPGGIIMDRALCRVYGLKAGPVQEKSAEDKRRE